MSAVLGLAAIIYGGSLVMIAGGSLLWIISPRFRRELVGDKLRR